MALEARDFYQEKKPQGEGLEQAGVIIEFPRPLTDEEKLQIQKENNAFILTLGFEQDVRTVEKAERDIKLHPDERLVDLYFNNPNKRKPDFSGLSQPETDRFGMIIFRHNEERHIL